MSDYLNDIGVGLSHSAFRNTSHTPERRGDSFRAEYAQHLAHVADWSRSYSS
jgi:hypothetical protein